MGSVIASHNPKINQPTSNNHGCSCRKRVEYPLDNKYLTANIVSVRSKPDKKYFGIAETSYKDQFRNRTRDSHQKKYVNSTKLSKYMWKLKNEKITASIK